MKKRIIMKKPRIIKEILNEEEKAGGNRMIKYIEKRQMERKKKWREELK